MNIDSNVFIAPGAQIIGDVNIKSGSSIWYNAVLRGDEGAICIGSIPISRTWSWSTSAKTRLP